MKCSACPCRLDSTIFPLPRAQGKVVCKACYELWKAIYSNAHFISAQVEYEQQMKKLNKLRIGADYFEE